MTPHPRPISAPGVPLYSMAFLFLIFAPPPESFFCARRGVCAAARTSDARGLAAALLMRELFYLVLRAARPMHQHRDQSQHKTNPSHTAAFGRFFFWLVSCPVNTRFDTSAVHAPSALSERRSLSV